MPAASLRVLTFNAGLLNISLFGYSLLKPTDFLNQRLEQMGSHIAELRPDIVAFQEVYRPAHRNRLMHLLRDVLPYSGFAGNRMFYRLPNALLVLSRYPINECEFIKFKQKLWPERMVATRGYLRVKVDLPESGPLTLFNLHPTPGRFSDQSSDYSDVVRKAQLEQLLAAAKATPGNVLLLGDFNCGPEVSSVNYQQPLEAGAADVWDLAAERLNPELTDSWDPLNPLNVGNVHSHCPAQRIDHIFLSPQLSSVSTVASAGVVLHESVVDLAEGGPVPLSDHYGMFAELKFGSGDSEE